MTFVNIPEPSGSPSRNWLRYIGIALLFTALAVGLQWLAGCYWTELSGYPDEPAHLLNGVLVRDYILSGFKMSPVQFAEQFYLHYPKIAFGIWPPLFHFVEGAWFLIFPPTEGAAFVLQALIMGLLAAVLGWVVMRRYGAVLGLASGAVLVCMPVIQRYTAMIMADNLASLLGFCSMLLFAGYVERKTWRWAIGFGLVLGLAVMTKSNAAALGLMPVLTLLLLRRYRELFAPLMFAAAAVALVITVPWQLLVIRTWTGTVSFHPYSLSYVIDQLWTHVRIYATVPGPVVWGFALVGIVQNAILPFFRKSLEPLWAAAAALGISLFLSGLAPLPAEERYHFAAMAAITFFAAAGANWVALRIPGNPLRNTALVTTAAAALFAWTTFTIPPREAFGYKEAAQALLANPDFRDSVMLISSERGGEGMFVPEIAMHETRPSHYVLRGSKVLGTSRWDSDSYQLLYTREESLQEYLESTPISLLVIDSLEAPSPVAHHRLLRRTVAKYAGRWTLVGTYPHQGPYQGHILVYRLEGPLRGRHNIAIDMKYTLQRIIKESDDSKP